MTLLASGCASSSKKSSAPPSSQHAGGGGSSQSVTIESHSGDMGTFLTDGSGKSLYLFASDHGSASTCTGACATTWPPVIGTAKASGGAQAAMLGTITRSDGSKQVTYSGHPLYWYAADTSAGETNGQGLNQFGALWWLVSPAGKAITSGGGSGSGSSTSSKAGGGGGWS